MKSSKTRTRRCGNSRLRCILGEIKMKCLCSGEQMRPADEMVNSSEFGAGQGYSVSAALSAAESENVKKPDNGNIEEAELSLRETSSLNYEEARALLGRIEYQKGNVEAALRVFEGIDINGITPKMKITLGRREEQNRRRSKSYAAPPPMSIHAVSLLFEAIFLKAKSLQHLGRYQEAAQSCKVILDIVESSLPESSSENFGGDCKLQETLIKAVELLPELWKLADSPREAILSYRRALLNHWKLDAETTARIQKEFAVFLLYSGEEAAAPNLRSQMEGSFIPRNNIEEAILLLMILLRKVNLKRIAWDAAILDHLSFALSIAGDLRALAKQLEELLPEIMGRRELYHNLSLCYYGTGEDLVALDLLRKSLGKREDPDRVPDLLIASKICGDNSGLAEEGIDFVRKALRNLESECNQLESTAHLVLGILLSEHSRTAITESERVTRQSEALQALETAERTSRARDPNILYHLALENAEQRKLDASLFYAKSMIKLEGGSNLKGWLLLARILSAQKRFADAETIINAAVDQTGKWDQGKLLRMKAKLRIAQGEVKGAIETYTLLLALLQVQSKGSTSAKKLHKGSAERSRSLELETWHDLAHVYVSLSQWHDAETCLSRSKSIVSYSSARCHAEGVLYKRKGLLEEALKASTTALDIDPTHVPSLIFTAEILQELRNQSNAAVIRSFLVEALRLDRTNPSAWFGLGKLYISENTVSSMQEALECFQAAALLEETAPIEPFR